MIMGAVYLSYSAFFLSADFNGIKQFMRVRPISLWNLDFNSIIVPRTGSYQCKKYKIVFDSVERVGQRQQIKLK